MAGYLAQRWKELLIGVLATCLAYSVSRVFSDAVAFRDKIAQLPSPAEIATKNEINEKINVLNTKVDSNNSDTKESLKRIESKIDSLMLVMATHQRESRPKETALPATTRAIPAEPIASAANTSATHSPMEQQ